MSEVKWTSAQKEAIETKNKSLIVSAAAGSGKTAVLVERIIDKICSEDNPSSIDRMLIVTYTRAAAGEMREKISVALDKRLKNDPLNKHLIRQKMLLPLAEICTMDQFFNSIVRENFSKLSITPDFRILDEGEAQLLSNEAVEEILEECYESRDKNFESLLEITGCDKNDYALANYIKSFARNANAYPEPEKWLESIKEVYSSSKKPQDTVFGEIILKEVVDICEYAAVVNKRAQLFVQNSAELEKVLIVLKDDENLINNLIEISKNKEWDNLKCFAEGIKFGTFPSFGKKSELQNCPERLNAKLYRDRMKKLIEPIKNIIPANEKEYFDDAKLLEPAVCKFVDIVIEYKTRLIEKKKAENSFGFEDIVNFTLQLLSDNGKPSEFAYELRNKYDEILIDEYQDTNEAQDKIFSSISKEEKNLFLVGDVKQSIYRFRLAMPQVFLNKINLWNGKCDYAKHICLDNNFRSCPEIINFVNYIFERVMSVEVGDICYDDTQTLKHGTGSSGTTEKSVDFLLLDKASAGEEYTEPKLIADKIELLLKSETVFDKDTGENRRVEPKDICILLRQNKISRQISEELTSRGIPSFYQADGAFFDSPEISTMLSLLSIINNPLQDIPLVGVLLSPLFGFSLDDISDLRIGTRKGKLYYAVKTSDNEKCRYFIKKYNEYRSLSTVIGVSELLRTVYEDSGYITIVTALNDGEKRRLNLLLLLEYASAYEEFGKSGLSGFMRYTERMKKNNSDIKTAGVISENADAVRIMTIHKSKGLEFPIVFLSDCGREKNTTDLKNNIIIHEKIGMGIRIKDKKTFRKYSTVPYEATKILTEKSNSSEELRVIYVALTRAKEKLIITSQADDAYGFIKKTSGDCIEKVLNPVAVKKSNNYAEILVKSLMYHPDAFELRKISGLEYSDGNSSGFNLNFEIINRELCCPVENKNSVEKSMAEINYALLEEIKERTSFVYPYSELADCSIKIAASSFNKSSDDFEYFASEIPEFMQDGNMTSAQKGTATHRFMETCDFTNAFLDMEAEFQRLKESGNLTQQQAENIDCNSVKRFFESGLYRRIVNSEKVFKEQKFRIGIPVNQAYPEFKGEFSDEIVLVQGIIDCAFFEDDKIVVLDYKTDKVQSSDELVKRYSRQLEIYKIAAEQIFEREVKELLLYSFYLGEEKKIIL